MGVFTRENGEWVESDLRARVGSDWTDQYDNGYIRVGSEWVQFQPGAQGVLLAPVNLAVTPFDISATGTWQNPSQSVTPTHVQVRCPELTTVWTEYTYPHTSVTFPVLYPSTAYQMQVRYIVRTLGEITATGPIATHFFTTLAPQSPGLPAPDPGGSGGDSVIWWPSTGGTPGPVDGPGCWWEYQVQEFDADTYIWSDSSLHGEFAGDLGELSIDFITEGFDCGATLRFKYREICGGTPEAWVEAEAFNVPCDWDDPCGGVEQTAAFSDAPWTDAVFAMPKICFEAGQMQIEDFIAADVEYGKLSAFLLHAYPDSTWELRARDDLSLYGEPIAAGHVPALVPIGSSVPSLTSDFSFTGGVRLEEPPTAGSGASVKLFEVGKTVRVYAYAQGSGFRVTASVPKMGGGYFTLASTVELALDEWHTISVTIDQDGDKILYVDSETPITDSDVTRANFAGFTGDVELYANDRMRVHKVGGWARELSPEEAADLSRQLTYFSSTWSITQDGTSKNYTDLNWSYLNPFEDPVAITAIGGSGGGGMKAGRVVATRELEAGVKHHWFIGGWTISSTSGGQFPGGGQGCSGTAFTQAGGGGGYSGILKAPHASAIPSDVILIAGGTGGDPNGSGVGPFAGGFTSDGDAQYPNVSGTPGLIGGSTTGQHGGQATNSVAQSGQRDGSFLRGGNNYNNSEDSGGGGGGYYGGCAGEFVVNAGGGGSSFVDADCTGATMDLTPTAGVFGTLQLVGALAIPPAAQLMVDNGAAHVWPMWDPLGLDHKAIVGTDAIPASTVYVQPVVAQVAGPDGFFYYTKPKLEVGTDAPYTPYPAIADRDSTRYIPAVTIPQWPAAPGAGGFYVEGFLCRTGPRPTTSANGMMSFALDSGSVVTSAFVEVGISNGGDSISFLGVTTGAMNIFNTLNQWRHVAYRLDASGVVHIYVDGVQVASGARTINTVGAHPFYPFSGRRGADICCPHNMAGANIAVYGSDGYSAGHVADVMEAFGL